MNRTQLVLTALIFSAAASLAMTGSFDIGGGQNHFPTIITAVYSGGASFTLQTLIKPNGITVMPSIANSTGAKP